jgi:hypothetical protein
MDEKFQEILVRIKVGSLAPQYDRMIIFVPGEIDILWTFWFSSTLVSRIIYHRGLIGVEYFFGVYKIYWGD